jgi:hypothetical protein
MTAIESMVAILLVTPKWRPERSAAHVGKRCSECKTVKPLREFAFGGSSCKECRALAPI